MLKMFYLFSFTVQIYIISQTSKKKSKKVHFKHKKVKIGQSQPFLFTVFLYGADEGGGEFYLGDMVALNLLLHDVFMQL